MLLYGRRHRALSVFLSLSDSLSLCLSITGTPSTMQSTGRCVRYLAVTPTMDDYAPSRTPVFYSSRFLDPELCRSVDARLVCVWHHPSIYAYVYPSTAHQNGVAAPARCHLLPTSKDQVRVKSGRHQRHSMPQIAMLVSIPSPPPPFSIRDLEKRQHHWDSGILCVSPCSSLCLTPPPLLHPVNSNLNLP